jgi:hypothetical protein
MQQAFSRRFVAAARSSRPTAANADAQVKVFERDMSRDEGCVSYTTIYLRGLRPKRRAELEDSAYLERLARQVGAGVVGGEGRESCC